MNEKIKWKVDEIGKLSELAIEGNSISDISKELCRSYHSTSHKLNRIGIKHPSMIPSFNALINPELSYVLGAWLGDRTSPSKLGISVKDKDFAVKFHSCLEKILNRKIKVYGDMFFVQRIDKNFAEWVKDKDIKEIKYFIESGGESAITNFLCGFFDAEGTVIKKYTKVTQKDKKILEVCKELLIKLNISSSLFKENRKNENESYYVLRIEKLSSMINFYNKVGFSILRKKDKLRNIIKTKLKNHPSSLEKYNKFLFMKQEGLSIPLIAKELEISEQTAYNWKGERILPILAKNKIKISDIEMLES